MARKSFHVNTEPHEVEILGKVLFFQPEVIGAEFASAYKKVAKVAHMDLDQLMADPDMLTEMEEGIRGFLSTMMLPESRAVFEDIQLSLRVLTEMLEWAVELYGGGPGNDDGGSSSAS